MSDLKQSAWLIHKSGRGWYRANAEGYCNSPADAGRYGYDEAISHIYPNGPDGPQDGLTMWNEREVPGAIAAPPTREAIEAEIVAWLREWEWPEHLAQKIERGEYKSHNTA